jgi:multiple sugar transport system permease protein
MKKHSKIETFVVFSCCIIWSIICLFPLYDLIAVTFSTDQSDITRTLLPNSFSNGITKIGLAFSQATILKATIDSARITLTAIVVMLIVASLAAYELALYRFPLKKVFFSAIMASMMLPFVLYVIPLYRFIASINLGDTIPGISLPLAVSALSVFILIQFLEDMPKSLIESAHIDGIGHFRIFRSIVFPLMSNALITVTVLMFMSVWSTFLWPSLVASLKIRPMSVAIANLLDPRFYTDERVKIAAMLISSIVPLTIYGFFQRYIIQGIAASGVKG